LEKPSDQPQTGYPIPSPHNRQVVSEPTPVLTSSKILIVFLSHFDKILQTRLEIIDELDSEFKTWHGLSS